MENKQKINAQIIADSIDNRGNRITTFILTYPRMIHSELLTHRLFSRNSASSRAIPFEKMVKMVEEDPFIPIAWQFDHKGMQGNEYVTEESDYGGIEARNESWLQAKDFAIQQAKDLSSMDTTKQLCNRLLEPFMWHTVLVTATEWENFFELRCPKYQTPVSRTVEPQRSWKDLLAVHSNPANEKLITDNKDNWAFKMQHSLSSAEIHIQALAEAMWDAMNESTPKQLNAGEWHIPFGDKLLLNIKNYSDGFISPDDLKFDTKELIKIATARCARLSYMTFDGEIDYKKDIELHNKLLESYHMSPFEHCARIMDDIEYESFHKGQFVPSTDEIIEDIGMALSPNSFGWCNNFKGFIQYRYLIENGNS